MEMLTEFLGKFRMADFTPAHQSTKEKKGYDRFIFFQLVDLITINS